MLRYWLGQWDDALAELESYETGSSRLPAGTLVCATGARCRRLIAGRREQRTTAGLHLRQGLASPIESRADRENQDFLVASHALALEQGGETGQAMLRLATILARRDGEMTLTHQWMPDLVRLALASGDLRVAEAARQTCQAEAAAETRPARAAAASLRCRGLLECDPSPLAEVVAHYRTVGPPIELPSALEDLAVVLAQCEYENDARAALDEAVGLYEDLQARWDMRRAESRLRAPVSGVASGPAVPSPPAPAGRRLPRPRSKSPPSSPRVTPPRTSPAACSCPGGPCRPISRTSWPSSGPIAG